MSASGHYTRGRSLRIKDKAVSVSSPCCRRFSSPTLLIGSRRARLLTFSAALRSPQTCFRLPHCLGNRHTCCLASQPPAFVHPPLSGGHCCLRQRQPAAFPALPPCGMPTSGLFRCFAAPQPPVSQPLSAAADIPFQGNSRPLRPRRRSSCCRCGCCCL